MHPDNFYPNLDELSKSNKICLRKNVSPIKVKQITVYNHLLRH